MADAGIRFRLLDGTTASERDWRTYHGLYESTFHRRGGIPKPHVGLLLHPLHEILQRSP